MRKIAQYQISTRRAIVKNRISKTIKHLVLIFWSFTTLYPIVWVLQNAFKNNSQIFGNPFAFPDPIIWKNFPQAFGSIKLGITLTNSFVYASVSCALTMLLAAMAAFYLAKISRSNLLFLYFLFGIMIPVQAILIPIFVTMRNLQLLNTRTGIIIVYIATHLSFSIFILAQFMKKGVPNELLEAAVMDGCGPVRAFFSVALPISQAGIATAGTFVFLFVWNEFLFALLMLPDPLLRTLNLSVYMLRGQYDSDQGLMAAGVVILITPAVIFYVLFQEQVVKGLTAGSIKG